MKVRLCDLIENLLKQFEYEASLRDEVIKLSREIISLAKSVIISTHNREYDRCEETLIKLKDIVNEFIEKTKRGEKLYYSGMVRDTLTEYVEAIQFYNLAKRGKYVKYEEINVPPSSYILGLLDTVGELRRLLLDLLKNGDLAEAERMLSYMEEIYSAICLLNIPDAILPGYRRKCDVTRQLLERSKSELVYVKATMSIINNLIKGKKLKRN